MTTAAIRLVYAWAAFGLAAATARAEMPQATIAGGPDATGQSYVWTVTNHHASAIVHLEIPHYRASLFFAPEGWRTECTNLVAVGVKDLTGVCTASTDSPASGIAAGRSATFSMQIAGGGAKRGLGAVVVRFADGVTQTIAGVPVPTAEPPGDRNIPLLGLGTVFMILIVVRAARRRRAREAESG
ncbi:MAG: hypothetical protein Q7R41_02400 [Phycisphaerales bacterium]|nr:hypothetical protein [Phycisphaerales bacterium]